MTSVQAWLADVLEDALDNTFVVRGYPFAPDEGETGKSYVAVYRSQTIPAPMGKAAFQHTISVVLMTPHADPRKADEKLDAALLPLLAVLENDDDLKGLVWTEAVRTVHAERYPSLSIACTVYEPRS